MFEFFVIVILYLDFILEARICMENVVGEPEALLSNKTSKS